MQEIPTYQTPQQTQPKGNHNRISNISVNSQNRSKFIGIVFVTVFILLVITLNYFNILKLSTIFPKFFGFLPHRSLSPQQTQITNNLPQVPYDYDLEIAKTFLSKYIIEVLKPKFVPSTLDVKQGLFIGNRLDENRKDLYGLYIDNPNETISIAITLIFIENSDLPNDFKIFIIPKKTDQTVLKVESANSLLSSYFTNPIPIEKCNTNGTTSYCKIMKTESDGKREYGATIALDSSKSPPVYISTIFNCFTAKESNYYDLVQSCTAP